MMYKIFLLPFRQLYTEVTNTYRVLFFTDQKIFVHHGGFANYVLFFFV